MFDNREISFSVWLGIFAVWALSKAAVRKASTGVLRAALSWRVILLVTLASVYVAMVVTCLHVAGLWNSSDLKPTILWGLTAGFAMLIDVESVPNDERYFRKMIRDGFNVSVILEFIVNLYVLNLFFELLLVPTATILGCMVVIAESRGEYKPVRSLLKAVMTALGIGLLVYSAHRIYIDPQSFARFSTAFEFLLPMILTLLFLPLLYLLATVVSYETLFVRLRILMSDTELRRFTRVQLIRRFGLDFRGLNRWAKSLVFDRLRTREQVVASMENALP